MQRVRAMQRDQTLCLICRDEVVGRPCYTTMVCPGCASAWFHRRCIQVGAIAPVPAMVSPVVTPSPSSGERTGPSRHC